MGDKRRNVILYGSYQRAFFARAIEEDLVVPHDPGIEEFSVSDVAANDYLQFYKMLPHKNSMLQMMLVSDNLILIDADNTVYDTSALEGTGLVQVVGIEQDPHLMGEGSFAEADRAYAMYLKPFLIDRMTKRLSTQNRLNLRQFGLSGRQFCSGLYDLMFSDDEEVLARTPKEQIVKFVGYNTDYFYNRNRARWSSSGVGESTARQFLASRWAWEVKESAGTLMALLEKSVTADAMLVQSEYKFGRVTEVGVAEYLNGGATNRDAYLILRSSFEKCIGSLPSLRTIGEVIDLKDRRSGDIRRLRQVVWEIEECLREGRAKAASKAVASLEKASRDLSRGARASKVSRWATYLSVPVGAVEGFMRLPPLAGLTVGIVGVASTLVSDVSRAKNRWTQVVR